VIAEKGKQLDGMEELIEKASTEGAQMHTKCTQSAAETAATAAIRSYSVPFPSPNDLCRSVQVMRHGLGSGFASVSRPKVAAKVYSAKPDHCNSKNTRSRSYSYLSKLQN
jgi:hypothetical protein